MRIQLVKSDIPYGAIDWTRFDIVFENGKSFGFIVTKDDSLDKLDTQIVLKSACFVSADLFALNNAIQEFWADRQKIANICAGIKAVGYIDNKHMFYVYNYQRWIGQWNNQSKTLELSGNATEKEICFLDAITDTVRKIFE